MKKHVLLIQHGSGPDYLADMVSHTLILNDHYHVSTNEPADYLFADHGQSNRLYGRGFTLYNRLPPNKRPVTLTASSIRSGIEDRIFDLIVYSSIRRCQAFFDLVQQRYPKSKILAYDGEDDQAIDLRVHRNALYFKREVPTIARSVVHPVSFAFPEITWQETKLLQGESKCHLLAPCDPRDRSTYRFQDEADYYRQYARSMFGFTSKKGGWDCLRHYEIIACGCVPWFPDILYKPPSIMVNYPVALQLRANQLYKALTDRNFDPIRVQIPELYFELRTGFLSWLEQSGTTRCLARMIEKDWSLGTVEPPSGLLAAVIHGQNKLIEWRPRISARFPAFLRKRSPSIKRFAKDLVRMTITTGR